MLDKIHDQPAADLDVSQGRDIPVVIESLATAVPPRRYAQGDIKDAMRAVFGGRSALFKPLESVFDNAGIAHRHVCQPLEWFFEPATFAEKTRLYTHHALALIESAATDALAGAGLAPGEIDGIVCVSSTGIATPSLDAHLINRMDFREDVVRLPIFGLGCAGGVLGFSHACAMARMKPGFRCLLLVVELCTLAYRFDRLTKSALVATALFGDGAAAAVISSGTSSQAPDTARATIGPSGEHCWKGMLDVMGWDVDEHGFDVIFHRDIPDIIAAHYTAALDKFLAREGLSAGGFDHLCSHPGGPKVLDALERCFKLKHGAMARERAVLRDFGNMSAPTVLFVLDALLSEGARGSVLMTALGPGFTAAFQQIDILG